MYRLSCVFNECVAGANQRNWSQEFEERRDAEEALWQHVVDLDSCNLSTETADTLQQTLADHEGDADVETWVKRLWGSDLLTDHRVIATMTGDIRWRPGDNTCDCGDFTLRITRDPGRPLGSGEGRTITFRLKLTPEERERLDRLAEGAGCTPSQYVRSAVFDDLEDLK